MQEIRVIKGKPQQKLLLINGENEAEFITDLPFSAYLGYRGYLCPQGGERLPLRLKKNVYHTVSLLLGQAEANNLTGVGKFYLELNQKGGFWQSEKGEYQTARAAILSAGNAIPSEQPESIFPPLTVDVSQRTVIIPGGSLQIGVERDHNARRIRFYCPRYRKQVRETMQRALGQIFGPKIQ